MKKYTRTQLLSLIVGIIAAMAGLITSLGQTWGFDAIGRQIAETCFAFSGFANIVFFGITIQKAKANTVFSEELNEPETATPQTTEPAKTQAPKPKHRGTNIDGVIK